MKVSVPLDVPARAKDRYRRNYQALTAGTGRLMLFAGDQKVEHLNSDFFGPGISAQDADPEHLFKIASEGRIGVFAAQIGLIARYGMDYPQVPYLVKLNSKTNLVETEQSDPYSAQWLDVSSVEEIREDSGLNILGVGYTVYLGSEEEASMLEQAARIVIQAHRAGLLTVLWMYPRGRAIQEERDPHLIAGACGVAAALGSDFVKVNYPAGAQAAYDFREAVLAAGRTGVVCAGGSSQSPQAFLSRLYDQIHISGAAGNATGRNIHQKDLAEAVRMCNAIYAITVENRTLEESLEMLEG